jgi:hypothetical protein
MTLGWLLVAGAAQGAGGSMKKTKAHQAAGGEEVCALAKVPMAECTRPFTTKQETSSWSNRQLQVVMRILQKMRPSSESWI